jgi:hypothetical protein
VWRTSWQASLADPPTSAGTFRDWVHDLGRRGRIAFAGATVVVILVMVLGAASVFWRYQYGTWPWSGYPSELSYCNRIYGQVREERVTQPIYAAFEYDAPLVPSHAVFADLAKGDHVGDSPACAGFLFIRMGPDRAVVYKIHGDT